MTSLNKIENKMEMKIRKFYITMSKSISMSIAMKMMMYFFIVFVCLFAADVVVVFDMLLLLLLSFYFETFFFPLQIKESLSSC